MKEFDVIAVGTGSAMNIISAMQTGNPELKVAVIDKDEPGGICLTRGCIPSKLLLHPADLIRTIQSAGEFGIEVSIRNVDFKKVMERMQQAIGKDIEEIRHGLAFSPNLTYYPVPAEFVAPYTLKAGNETIKAPLILLCTGSRPLIPPIKGLDKVAYLTSDTVLRMRKLPPSIGIIGGGYIAAEYGHFFSAMGSNVTIIGRHPQFLPGEEPEVSAAALAEMSRHMTILTNTQVVEVEHSLTGRKTLVGINRQTGQRHSISVDEILVAAGRASNADILHPERSGILVDEKGWISVDEYLETAQPGIWAFGDATGKHMFKHVANYESAVVYYNAVQKKKVPADYHAVPHAVFAQPEIAAVGMREQEAIARFGRQNVLIGVARFGETAKGMAMGVRGGLAKVIAQLPEERLVGAHIIGPQASVLIQELVTLMYTREGSASAVRNGMHIHPALGEVVERAVAALMPVDMYYRMLEHEKEHHRGH